MEKNIIDWVNQSLAALGIAGANFNLEHPSDLANGDYSTNAALVVAKQSGQNPKDLATKLLAELEKNKPAEIEKIEMAGPGFINFFLTSEFFNESIKEVLKVGEEFGKGKALAGQKTIVEYTDANPFKEFHIGHLMSNTIGESLARLIESQGAEVKRACYQGDVGLHVAKAVWGLQKSGGQSDNVKDLSVGYATGATAYETDEQAKAEIIALNKKIYDRSDEVINKLYDQGKKTSLAYFETIYKKLGTKFDFNFFESETGKRGQELVEENIGKIFEKSDGAIVFHAETHDPKLHTRVFINAEGLPTYESKELGLAEVKFKKYLYDCSVVITGNEVTDYFRVLLKALELIFPDLAKKTVHLPHGMLRLPSGKMSSRTGDVITAEALLAEVGERVKAKMADRPLDNQAELINHVSVAALKYAILRQAIGRDTIFEWDKALSFEGDSGPYLQYAYVRTQSILTKAKEAGIDYQKNSQPLPASTIQKLLYRFPEVVAWAAREYAPQTLATYLIEVAGAFNSYYATNKIIDPTDPTSPAKIALTAAVGHILQNGLQLLGISTPDKM